MLVRKCHGNTGKLRWGEWRPLHRDEARRVALIVGVVSPGPSFLMVARTAVAGSRADGVAAGLAMAREACCLPSPRCWAEGITVTSPLR